MDMNKSKKILLKLNSVQENKDDFTLVNVTFIIVDEFLSGNGQIMEKDVLTPALPTLKDKPIVAKYYKVSEANAADDALGDHQEFIDTDREGNKFINTDTTTIGHFTTEGYYADYNGKEVVMCDGVLNADRFPDIIELLKEWMDNGIQINSSVEYYYCNYEIRDGIEYIKSPVIFSGHCILNSEDRGDSEVIPGAYSDSQLLSLNQKITWNKAVSQQIKVSKNQEEGELSMKFFKKTCQLSHGDIRSKIYGQLEKKVSAEEYWDLWISEVYDESFIYCIWNSEDSKYNYFKVEYVKDDENNTVEINLDSKVKVERDWVEVQNHLESKNSKIEKLEKDIDSKDSTITSLNNTVNTLTTEKANLSTSLNSATGKLTSLNAKLDELQKIEKQFNQEQFEKALNSQKEKFEKKFKSVNALERFNSDEVQELIEKSIDDESALVSLNAMVVELVPDVVEQLTDNKLIKELNTKKLDNLIPKDNSFESRYMED